MADTGKKLGFGTLFRLCRGGILALADTLAQFPLQALVQAPGISDKPAPAPYGSQVGVGWKDVQLMFYQGVAQQQ